LGEVMPALSLNFLSGEELDLVHTRSVGILEKVGVQIGDPDVLDKLGEMGARIDRQKGHAWISETLISWALEYAGKRYVLHGRQPGKIARFGYGDSSLMSSPGQITWHDHHSGKRSSPRLANVRQAAILGDALEEIAIVGGLGVPEDVPGGMRDVAVVAELVRYTGKPTRAFPISAQSSRYVLEIYAALAGGREALCRLPMTETLLDPISPLQFSKGSLEITKVFIEYGQPICVAPMALAGGTSPVTLAGTVLQQNAEALAGIVIVQALRPGHPVMVGGIPHILDPRSMLVSFGSPEQSLMAVAMTQMARRYGMPVYINVNLSDSKRLDLQAGMEKMAGLVIGILSGADLFGHAGILGADQGGSLAWLAADHYAMQFARRMAKGFSLDDEHLAEEVIARVGPGGNFMSQKHTVDHLRSELWIPNPVWNRQSYREWAASQNESDMASRILDFVDRTLEEHQAPAIDPSLEGEIDRIVEAARRELG
jgi:trimethylamine--corrinoid protein Co-methyltransferase